MQREPRKILAVVSDLFFSVKIADASKRAGMLLEFVKDPEQVLVKAQEKPQLIIFDLNFDAADPVNLIGRLKGNEDTRGINLLGFVSHVQGELKQRAQEAGCDMVMARSAFSVTLPQIFKRHSGSMM
jgi:PleD family two-component response regulator